MQANLSHYEDVAELEDDILDFLPTVSYLEVFGCEIGIARPSRAAISVRGIPHGASAAAAKW